MVLIGNIFVEIVFIKITFVKLIFVEMFFGTNFQPIGVDSGLILPFGRKSLTSSQFGFNPVLFFATSTFGSNH